MSTIDFYRTQATQCRQDASKATLDNVRERSERAASAWDDMANRLSRTLAQRDLNTAAKAQAEADAEA